MEMLDYRDLLSVEMMHCKNDGKFYFTEINLRMIETNQFIIKYRANFPLNHIEDLLGESITEQITFTQFFISERCIILCLC